MNVAFQWSDMKDDGTVVGIAQGVVDKAIALGKVGLLNTFLYGHEMTIPGMLKARDLHHRFIYQNYAYTKQDVFSGYGPENKEKLLAIQQKYDPEGVLEKLQPGYFKLASENG